jgi:hypothetical protein
LLAGRYGFNVVGCQHDNRVDFIGWRNHDIGVGDDLDRAHRVGPALLTSVPLQIFVLRPPSVIMLE